MTMRWSKRQWRDVIQLDVEFFDASSQVIGNARLQSAEVNGLQDYPSQGFEGADLWLVQDELDAYLQSVKGRVGWLDCLQKTQAGRGTNLSACFRQAWPLLYQELGCPLELLLYAYPLEVYDDAQASALKTKIEQQYLRHLGATSLPGSPFMRVLPPG